MTRSRRRTSTLTGFFNSTDEPGFYAPGRTGITAGPTLPWTDEATEKKIADAQASVRREMAAYERARAQAARDASARVDALVTNPAEARQAIQRSIDRGLAGYYPFDATAPLLDDQLRAAAASATVATAARA